MGLAKAPPQNWAVGEAEKMHVPHPPKSSHKAVSMLWLVLHTVAREADTMLLMTEQ